MDQLYDVVGDMNAGKAAVCVLVIGHGCMPAPRSGAPLNLVAACCIVRTSNIGQLNAVGHWEKICLITAKDVIASLKIFRYPFISLLLRRAVVKKFAEVGFRKH